LSYYWSREDVLGYRGDVFFGEELEAPMWGLRVPSAGLSHATKIGKLIRIVLFIDNKQVGRKEGVKKVCSKDITINGVSGQITANICTDTWMSPIRWQRKLNPRPVVYV
jgi:hypothetical protein